MDYTKNHHLPQWEKTDRVLMEDFNQMCRDMEAGLDGANASASTADAAAENRALARLRKLGYDLCQTAARSVAAGASLGYTKGLVYNGLTTAEERAKANGLYPPEDKGMWLGPHTGLTLEQLNAKITERQTGSAPEIGDKATAWLKFRSVGRGTITKVQVWLNKLTSHYYTTNITFRCYDLDTGKCTYTSEPYKTENLFTMEITHLIPVSIPIETGHSYRLEMEISSGSFFSGTIGFGTASKQSLIGEITPSLYTSGTVSGELTLASPACMALAVVHYSGGSAPTSVKVQNRAMTVSATRETVSARGAACTEREYYLEGEWTGTVSLSAAFSSPSKDMTIHDISWYLI